MNISQNPQPQDTPLTQERLKEILTYDTRKAAIHEGGHYVIARALGYPVHIEIRNLISETDDLENFTCTSGAIYGLGFDVPSFHLSIIGWGGVAAEMYAISPELDAAALSGDVAMQLEINEGVSITDVESIISHRQIWRTCLRACELVIEHWMQIEQIAALAHEAIVVRGEMEFIYPGNDP